jgi:hypothetical protein
MASTKSCLTIRASRASVSEERFRRIFKRTVEACFEAKIATAEVVHNDALLIRADVSWESLVERHASEVLSRRPPPARAIATKLGVSALVLRDNQGENSHCLIRNAPEN